MKSSGQLHISRIKLHDLIREARSRVWRSREKASEILQVGSRTLATYELGESLPDIDFLARLSKETGADFQGLVTARLAAAGIEGVGVGTETGPRAGLEAPEAAYRDEVFVPVPVYDIRAAAGGGALVEREKVETEVAFRSDWLRSLAVAAERLAVIRAVGVSMEPTICHGDALLLELTPERLIEGAVYVIAREDELLIKRPQRLPDGALVLRSDNPDYQAVTFPADQVGELRIIGRVRWIGRVV